MTKNLARVCDWFFGTRTFPKETGIQGACWGKPSGVTEILAVLIMVWYTPTYNFSMLTVIGNRMSGTPFYRNFS